MVVGVESDCPCLYVVSACDVEVDLVSGPAPGFFGVCDVCYCDDDFCV